MSLVFLDLIPNLAFFGSLTLFLALLVKSRLLTLLLSLFCLTGIFWINNRLPLPVGNLFQTVTGNVIIPSELVPTLMTPEILFNRIALLVTTCGLILCLCAQFTRNVPDRTTCWIGGASSIGAGVFVIVVMVGLQAIEQSQIARWVEEHNANFETVIYPDVHHLGGKIDIRPGRIMLIDLTLQVSVPANSADKDFVAFSFNPGFRITHLGVSGDVVEGGEFRHGLLKVPKRYFSSNPVDLQIKARGRPDQRFAYLDSVERVSSIVGPNVGQLRLLGTENSIFRPKFVVLVPGIKWYPTAGTATHEDDWESRRKDFFTVDIEVEVPKGWVVAGPSKRQVVTQSTRTIYQYQRSNPISEFALVGSEFDVAMMEVDGIEFELLFSKVHRQTIEQFSPFVAGLRERLQTAIDTVISSGFEFPDARVSLVEVPSVFRVYGGGKRMDTTMFSPGIILVRENAFPTMHIPSLLLPDQHRRLLADDPIELFFGRALEMYFTKQPIYESNLLYYVRNLAHSQTNATNSVAPTLNTVLELAVPQLLMQSEVYFDFDIAINQSVFDFKAYSFLDIFKTYSYLNFSFTHPDDVVVQRREKILTSPSVMSAVENVTSDRTEEFTPIESYQRALRLRARALTHFLIDGIGEENFGDILVELIQRHQGNNFVYSDFLDVFKVKGLDMDDTLGDWTSATKLPGFKASLNSSQELTDSDTGLPLYEAKILLHNGEPVAGSVRIWAADWGERWSSTKKVQLFVKGNSAQEIVLRSNYPMRYVWIEPYLSLNRMNLRVEVPFEYLDQPPTERGRKQTTIHKVTELSPHQTREYEKALSSSIIIDDLDAGFSVSNKNRIPTMFDLAKFTFGVEKKELDNGIPEFELFPLFPTEGEWERKTDPTAYGKYRRTFAISRAGWGDSQVFAKFEAKLPEPGRWKLEYFLARGDFEEVFEYQGIRRVSASDLLVGPIDVVIEGESVSTTETLNTTDIESGWHVIGYYNLVHPEVVVSVSNKTKPNHYVVIADAIRWTPVETIE